MLANALTSLLISVTRRYAKVSAPDVGIGISGGRLVVDDVELHADRLSSPALPFSIISGKAQRLAVRVPWSALSSSPVKIEIDNIKLIAGPRNTDVKRKRKESIAKAQPVKDWEGNRWYSSLLGRLLFNVAIELRGLVLVYQDEVCIGEIRLDGLRAYSCQSDWTEGFLALEQDVKTVALRKKVEVEGLTWFFPPASKLQKHEDEERTESAENSSSDEEVLDSANEVFESRHPVLNSMNVLGRVVVYAGEIERKENVWQSGYHCKIDLEVDEPRICFTARQVKWLQSIVETSQLGGAHVPDELMNGEKSPKKRQRTYQDQEDSRSEYSYSSDAEAYAEPEGLDSKRGLFSSLWDVLVGEYGDDSIDDAEIALGFRPRADVKLNPQRLESDTFVAQDAVRNAVHSGGFTWSLKMVTPDANARKELRKLRSALRLEKKFRERFLDVEEIIEDAEARIAAAEARAEALQEKNLRLQREIAEFEQAAGKAGQSKDAMIRQMQAALCKAETRLQALTAKKFPLETELHRSLKTGEKSGFKSDVNNESLVKTAESSEQRNARKAKVKQRTPASITDSHLERVAVTNRAAFHENASDDLSVEVSKKTSEIITSAAGLTLL